MGRQVSGGARRAPEEMKKFIIVLMTKCDPHFAL